MAKKRRFNCDRLMVTKDDDIDDAKDKNSKLIRKIKKAEKEVSQLRSQMKTMQDAWDKTQVFLSDFLGDSDLYELIEQSKTGKLVIKDDDKCKVCRREIKILVFSKFDIHVCENCKTKEKVEKQKHGVKRKTRRGL